MSEQIKTEENYEKWHNEKVEIESREGGIITNPGQFWTYKVGMNIGGEISKEEPFIRPCLILNNDIGFDLVTIVPLSTSYDEADSNKKGYFIEIENHNIHGLNSPGYLLLNQVKTISSKRLGHEISGKDRETGVRFKRYPLNKLKELQEKVISRTIGFKKTLQKIKEVEDAKKRKE